MKTRPDKIILTFVSSFALILGSLLLPTAHARLRNQRPALPGRSMPIAKPVVAGAVPESKTLTADTGGKSPETVGQPTTLDTRSPMSAEVFTAVGPGIPGLFPSFTTPALLANNDGREDFTADRAQQVDNIGPIIRTAVSEHSFANGFNENVFYEADSFGDFIIGVNQFPGGPSSAPSINSLKTISLINLLSTGTDSGVTLVNPGTLVPATPQCTSATVTVTGIAVDPVADLSDFGAACGTIGEVVYISVLDSAGCASNAASQPLRTRILALAFTNGSGVNAVTTFPNAFQIFTSPLSNSGIAVDDDGSLYFHQADLQHHRLTASAPELRGW